MHFDGTDLQLEYKLVTVANAGVNALVSVGLGTGNVVLESKGFRLEESMDGFEGQIAIVCPRDDDAKRQQVVHLLDGEVFFLHLSPCPGGMFSPVSNLDLRYFVCG
jgi:hypothetical protein